ncbi:Acyl-CoA dehydrogenase, C-terminal domain containing protein, putative [Angomonas deanei]|uniref:Acyl-CoA dehydrogenase, C-terminal domain containing protein, putative n=1 Tax=Angomonas deanei TaxID=59799 RepID=A0A7G2CN83_9TRYP|nr:Acyl-CoA dehydrogenase, C-terminal domain containing protein, putative [Angomonas deanei]
MVNQTRLCCMMGSSSSMATALTNAIHHCNHRNAFGGALSEKPLMQNVLTDLALESEACLALTMRVASSFNEGSRLGKDYMRLAVAVGKYITTKRCPAFTYECLECMGGNGYLEDFPLARYFRQSPLNAIWEGSGNVMVLDVFRTILKSPSCLQAVAADVTACQHPKLNEELKDVLQTIQKSSPQDAEVSGRMLVERVGVLLQAAALYHSGGDQTVFDRFVASRVGGRRGVQFGTLEEEFSG